LKRLSLTDLRVENLPRGVRRAALTKALTEFKLDEKWNKSSWARKINQRAKRASLGDFDRFKVMILRQKKAKLTHKAVKPVKK
jgi:large subunit ribosomal protein L14e